LNDFVSTFHLRQDAEFRALMSAIDRVQGVVELSLEGVLLRANANFLDWVGYRAEELVGQPHAVLCTPEYARSREYQAFWETLRAGEFHAGEFMRVAKGGSEVWINASYNPVFDAEGRVASVVKFATNVTAEKIRNADFEGKLRALDRSLAVIEFTPDGHILAANANLAGILGYAVEEVVGQHHAIFCQADYAASADYREFWAQLRLGEFRTGEYRRVRKDGSTVWLQASYNPVFDASGRLAKVVKFASDVTAARQRNLDFEAKMRALDLSQAIVEFDVSGRVLHANDNFLRIFNYSLDQVVGRHHLMFCEESYVNSPAYAEFWHSLGEGRFRNGQFKRIDGFGREVWLQATYNPVMSVDGRAVKIVKFASDITEQKRSNADFEGVVSAIKRSVAVIEFDLKGRILDVSPTMAQILEYQPEQLIGEHHTCLLDPDHFDQERYMAFWAQLRRGEPQRDDFVRRTRNGRLVHLQASYNPVSDAGGRIYKVIKFAVDLTERHALNEALREAVRKAESAIESKAMFLANMSHEIRTPMNAIIGFADLLAADGLGGKQAHYLETISTSARSLLHLLNDILDASKLEHGSMQIEQIDFCLVTVCERCIDTMGVLAKRKGIALESRVQPGMPQYFNGDPERLRQILINLISNAVKFTERGGITVELSMTDAAQVEVAVTDTGIGIPADRIDRIFEPFSQADGSITRKYGGTGLGTTIVRQLVTLMGGRIEVQSTLGVGSRFRVTLPLRLGKKPVSQGARDTDDVRPLRILVVDDTPQNLDLLVNVLARGQHQVVTAENGQRAVELYQQQAFDLVLMDVHMPVMNGLEAAREIRRLEKQGDGRRVPMIALTASVEAERRQMAIEACMDSFVMKPLDIAILRAEIARLTSGKLVAVGPVPMPVGGEAEGDGLDHVDWAGGINRWGGEDALVRAIRNFVSESAQLLRASLAEPMPDAAQIKQVMHRLKGAAANLSLLRVAAAAKRAESSAAEMNADAYTAALAHLAEEIDAVGQLLKARGTDASPAVARQHLDGAAMAELVSRIETTFRNFEIAEDLLLQLSAASPPAEFEPVQQAVDAFDFEAALRALESLRQAVPT
jgi:PAS domain S-box-containing protein